MLTHRETQVAHLLAQGLGYMAIGIKLGISAVTVSYHKFKLLRKLKIGPEEKYPLQRITTMIRYGAIPAPINMDPPAPYRGHALNAGNLAPTPTQMRFLRLLATGHSISQAAKKLGIKVSTATNLASQACKRAGIAIQNRHQKLNDIRKYLGLPHNEEQADPMDDPMF